MDTTTIFQHGTLGLLVPGLFDGTITAGELLTHGDTG
ncbi:acetolactate decarboxylase, partial [Lactiplantibacillus plantarum]